MILVTQEKRSLSSTRIFPNYLPTSSKCQEIIYFKYRQIASNSKTYMFLVSCCSCLCAGFSSQMLSREWRCCWSNAVRWSSNYIWVINSFIAHWGASYIKCLTVFIMLVNISSTRQWWMIKDSIMFVFCPRRMAGSSGRQTESILTLSDPLYVAIHATNHAPHRDWLTR